MRDFGSFSSPSRLPSLRTWVNEGQHSTHRVPKRRGSFSAIWAALDWKGRITSLFSLLSLLCADIGHLWGEGNY